MRIIKEFDEMQQAQKTLEASSTAILVARGRHVLGIWLCVKSASEVYLIQLTLDDVCREENHAKEPA